MGKKSSGCGSLIMLGVVLVVGFVALRASCDSTSETPSAPASNAPPQDTPPGAPNDEPANPIPPPPVFDPRHVRIAQALASAMARQPRMPSISPTGGRAVGIVPGRFRVSQVVGRGMILAEEIRRDRREPQKIAVQGIAVSGVFDQEIVEFGSLIFEAGDTYAYTTVLGAARTVPLIKVVERAEIVRVAHHHAAMIGERLSPLVEEEARLREIISLRAAIDNYSRQPDLPNAAQRVDTATARLHEMGIAPDVDTTEHAANARALRVRIQAERELLAGYVALLNAISPPALAHP